MQAEASFLDQTVAQPTYAVLARVSPGYPPTLGRLPTCYSPVRRSPEAEASFAHDLHVLSTPPAFILSQDQTLQFRPFVPPGAASARQAFYSKSTSRSATTPEPLPKEQPQRCREPGSRPLTSLIPLSSFQRTDAVLFRKANSDSTGTASRLSSQIAAPHKTTERLAREFPDSPPTPCCRSRNLPAGSGAVCPPG